MRRAPGSHMPVNVAPCLEKIRLIPLDDPRLGLGVCEIRDKAIKRYDDNGRRDAWIPLNILLQPPTLLMPSLNRKFARTGHQSSACLLLAIRPPIPQLQ
jgi:hypothetical protein